MEVAEHELDISGQLSLTTVQLRKRCSGPLQVSGSLGQISAKWSWSELLSQPIILNVCDANVQLHLTDAATEKAETPQDQSEPGFVGRLKRRLMDQINLTVSNCHISLAGLDGVLGGTLKRFSVAAARSGEQSVELEDLELYLARRDAICPTPFLWASPRGRALRFAGRRFVDLRGLDLQIDLEDIRVDCTRNHVSFLFALLGELQHLQDLKDFEDCNSDSEFVDCNDQQPPSWSNWMRSWAVWGQASEQGEQVELPTELKESVEELPVGKADFIFAMSMSALTVKIDDGLEVRAQGQASFHLHEDDAWDLEIRLPQLSMYEYLEGQAMASMALLSGITGGEHLVITASEREKKFSVCSPQLVLQITPALLRFAFWTQHICSNRSSVPTSNASDWHIVWHVPVTIEVGRPWHSQTLLLQALFVSDTGTSCSVLTGVELNGRQLVEEFAWTLQRTDRVLAVAESICCQCDIRDLVAVARMVKALYNFTGLCQNACQDETSLHIDVKVDAIKVSLADSDLAVRSDLCCRSLLVRLTQLAVGVSADDFSLSVEVAGQGRGSLLLLKPVARCSFPETFEVHLESEMCCHDPEVEGPAISCPSLNCVFLEDARDSEVSAILLTCRVSAITIRTTETFLQRCRLACNYALDHAMALLFVEPILLERRPFGLSIEASEIIATPQLAAKALAAGSTLQGLEPPATDVLEELQSRPLPVTLLFRTPSKRHRFTAHVQPIQLHAADFSVQRKMTAKIAGTDISFKEFQQRLEGFWPDLIQKIASHYLAQAAAAVPKLFCNLTIGGLSVFDSTISSAGTSLALLRFGGTAIPHGALAGTLAKAVATATSSCAQKGRKLRDGDEYQFGDCTRGLISLSWEKGVQGTASAAAAHAYETGAASATVGASVGGVLLAPLGPAGVTAGMMGGAAAARSVSEGVGRHASAVRKSISQTLAEGREVRETSKSGTSQEDIIASTSEPAHSGNYHFGDFTRGLLRAGREQRGGEGYKFGDFTRGAWSKMRR